MYLALFSELLLIAFDHRKVGRVYDNLAGISAMCYDIEKFVFRDTLFVGYMKVRLFNNI